MKALKKESKKETRTKDTDTKQTLLYVCVTI